MAINIKIILCVASLWFSNFAWECCGRAWVLCKDTALLNKDRLSLDETTIQALRLAKETIRLHGGPTAVPVTRSIISAVSHAYSKCLSYLENEKQKTALEAARKKEATRTAEHTEIARKKGEDLTNQFHEVEQQERVQSQEQALPSTLSMKLPVSCQRQSRQMTCRQQ